MSEIDAEVVRRLVTGRKNDGRAVYDPQAKAEVVRACLQPDVSVARMALQCGINANLLRRWITQSMGSDLKASRANHRPRYIENFSPCNISPFSFPKNK